MDAKAVCGAGVSNISCASVIGVGFFARILLTWYAFSLMRRLAQLARKPPSTTNASSAP